MVLNPLTSIPGRNRHRGGGDVEMEAKVGMVWPQAREHLEPPKAGGGKDRSCSPASRESAALLTILILDVRAPDFEEMNFCCFQPLGVWYFVMAATGT